MKSARAVKTEEGGVTIVDVLGNEAGYKLAQLPEESELGNYAVIKDPTNQVVKGQVYPYMSNVLSFHSSFQDALTSYQNAVNMELKVEPATTGGAGLPEIAPDLDNMVDTLVADESADAAALVDRIMSEDHICKGCRVGTKQGSGTVTAVTSGGYSIELDHGGRNGLKAKITVKDAEAWPLDINEAGEPENLAKKAEKMMKKAKWHIDRAGSGGSCKAAERYMQQAREYEKQADAASRHKSESAPPVSLGGIRNRPVLNAAEAAKWPVAKDGESPLVRKQDFGTGSVTARLYHNPEWEEYIVRFAKDGVYQGEGADYHTDDLEDAVATAKHRTEGKTESAEGLTKEEIIDGLIDEIGNTLADDDEVETDVKGENLASFDDTVRRSAKAFYTWEELTRLWTEHGLDTADIEWYKGIETMSESSSRGKPYLNWVKTVKERFGLSDERFEAQHCFSSDYRACVAVESLDGSYPLKAAIYDAKRCSGSFTEVWSPASVELIREFITGKKQRAESPEITIMREASRPPSTLWFSAAHGFTEHCRREGLRQAHDPRSPDLIIGAAADGTERAYWDMRKSEGWTASAPLKLPGGSVFAPLQREHADVCLMEGHYLDVSLLSLKEKETLAGAMKDEGLKWASKGDILVFEDDLQHARAKTLYLQTISQVDNDPRDFKTEGQQEPYEDFGAWKQAAAQKGLEVYATDAAGGKYVAKDKDKNQHGQFDKTAASGYLYREHFNAASTQYSFTMWRAMVKKMHHGAEVTGDESHAEAKLGDKMVGTWEGEEGHIAASEAKIESASFLGWLKRGRERAR